MIPNRVTYIVIIAAFLTVGFWGIPGRMIAQSNHALMPPCDSVVTDDGQGHRSVAITPLLLSPSKAESCPENIIKRKQFTTLDEIVREQVRFEQQWNSGYRSLPTRDLSSYATGSIPIQESFSPTGARTYSIPIATAAGWDFTPNVSLVYNSQAGNNVAGYGWGISGLSSITVRNSNLYYDGVAESNSYNSLSPKYALDGMPIVQSEMGITGYSYSTAKGNIQIKINRNQRNGRIVSFNALYPDGSTAVFGNPSSLTPHTTYPITSITDVNGNTISFSYTYLQNTYFVTNISYGSNASIDFEYSERNDTCAYKYASSRVYTDYLRKLLTTVTSRDGNNVICEYSLTHEFQDSVSLLKEVHCSSGSSELPPLLFTYGVDSENGNSSTSFEAVDNNFFNYYYTKSDDLSLICSRGQLIPDSQNNCVIILPQYDNYAALEHQWSWRDWTNYYKYGSAYNANQPIYCNVLGVADNIQKTILAGEGFQTIEAVDVDGDGVDELVKINNWSSSAHVTTYKITIYSFDSNANYTSSDFTITINDGTQNQFYINPAQSYYYFGNFRGDGKTMLLIVTKKSSKFALVDLNTHTKLSETSLFTLDTDDSYPDNAILVADFENIGKQGLCHITESDMKVYGLTDSTSTSLSFRSSFSGISKSQLYTDYTYLINGVPYHETAGIRVLDINGDGYLDIAAAPGWKTELNGSNYGSTVWNIARFNGAQFTTESISLYSHCPYDSIVFMDIDKDGLPDILHQHNSYLLYIPNKSGHFSISDTYSQDITTNSPFDIVPADFSLFGTKGEVLITYGPFVKVLELNFDHSARRNLETMTDSNGILHTNTYRGLNNYDGAYLTDLGRTYPSNDGYMRRALPINVLYCGFTYNGQQRIGSEFYTYWDAVYHNKGLGFCGFGKLQVRDSVNAVTTTTVFNPEKFGVAQQITSSKVYNGTPFSTVVNTYDDNSTTYGKLNPRLTSSVATDALTGIVTTTTCSYVSYDLPSTVVTSRSIGTGASQRDTLRRAYQHSITPEKFILGVVTEESIIKEGDGDDNMSWKEKTVITYDSLFRPQTSKKYVGKYGRMTVIPVDPPFPGFRQHGDSIAIGPPVIDDLSFDATNLVSETRWQYNSHGNVISEKSAPYGATEFLGDSLTYDSNGRYLIAKTDALGHTTSYSGYNKFGKPTTVTDYRGRVTTYAYDNWGNVVSVSHPDGSVEQTTVAWGGRGLYTVTTTATGQPESVTHYDALGREIHSGIKRFNGQWQWVDREYYVNGLLKKESVPYKGYAASYWNKFFYDDYNRPDSLHYASGKWSTWSYSGTSVTTIKDGISSTKTVDANGNVVSVTDAGGTITYTLRDDGQPSAITAPGNVSTSFTYDDYGRRISMADPSAGTQSDAYLWNSDGSSRMTHTNPNGTVKTYRDRFGRITLTERPGEYNTTYTYDSYGRLSTEQSTNGTGKEYTYDSLDRISSVKESAPDGKWLKKDYTYGAGSVISSITYISQADTITTETYNYANGFNTGITITGGTVVWNLTTENELGQPTRITTGTITRDYEYDDFGLPEYRSMDNGGVQEFIYSFSPQTGNLIERADFSHDTSEYFSYDNLNRLTSIDDRQITYASNGNILSMTGVGSMSYGDSQHPYQITSLTPSQNGLVPTRQQNVSYTSYNRPALLTEGGRSAAFTYNADGDRVKMNVSDNTGNVLTRYYLGGQYECDLTTSGTKERLYLGGDAYSATMVYQRENSGSWTAYNIGRDYLGSITHIATTNGTLVAEYSYDPWGRLRNPATLQIYTPGSEPELFLGRGFTGHEHLTWFGLINMNARLYDPLLGRFLSPDPYVQAPDFTQNFNRYSYALNNPLRYSDESGEMFFSAALLTAIGISATLGGISGWAIGKANNAHGWTMFGYIAGGACIGAIATLASAGVSAIGGAAWFAGATAGAIGGAGFRGLSTNWNTNAMIDGAWKGAVSGFIGGGISSAIGGGWGAFFGGCFSSAINSSLNGATANQAAISALFGGALSIGNYELLSYVAYNEANLHINGYKISYNQFKVMQADYQQSRFWRKEYGGILTNNGGVVQVSNNNRHSLSVQFTNRDILAAEKDGGILSSYHTHWAEPGVEYQVNDFNDIVYSGEPVTTTNGPSPGDINGIANYFLGNQILIDRSSFYYYDSSSIPGNVSSTNVFIQRFFNYYSWFVF